MAADLEMTLEANPTSVEAGKFRAFRRRRRQSRVAGRSGAGRRLAEIPGAPTQRTARRCRRWRGRGSSTASPSISSTRGRSSPWRNGRTELERALAFAAGHISLYQLTIETGTAFEQAFARGDFRMLDDEAQAAQFEWTGAPRRSGMPA